MKILDNEDGMIPYNLVITRKWIFAVLRRRERAEGIHVNALGYIGMLYASNEADQKRLLETGCLEVLKYLAV